MPIEDLARSDTVTADPETPVADLAATMAEENVGSVVITTDGTPVGIVNGSRSDRSRPRRRERPD
jgi:CBS domain-containing protein